MFEDGGRLAAPHAALPLCIAPGIELMPAVLNCSGWGQIRLGWECAEAALGSELAPLPPGAKGDSLTLFLLRVPTAI